MLYTFISFYSIRNRIWTVFGSVIICSIPIYKTYIKNCKNVRKLISYIGLHFQKKFIYDWINKQFSLNDSGCFQPNVSSCEDGHGWMDKWMSGFDRSCSDMKELWIAWSVCIPSQLSVDCQVCSLELNSFANFIMIRMCCSLYWNLPINRFYIK